MDRDDTWKIKTNEELNSLIRNKNIINYNKTIDYIWFGHVHRMTNDRVVKNYMSGYLETDIYRIGRKTNNQIGK
jgi:hypothetical protein